MADTIYIGGGTVSATATITTTSIINCTNLLLINESTSANNVFVRLNETLTATGFFLKPGEYREYRMNNMESFSVICASAETATVRYEALKMPTMGGRSD